MNIIGDVAGKTAIFYDDIIDTAGTICAGAQSLHDAGAKEIYAICTHGILSGKAIERINESPIKELIITNSIPLERHKDKDLSKITVLSIASILGDAILCIDKKGSMSLLFD
mgnify:CR=1 FL=1